MTIEQIILLFKDVAERHKQINGFVVSEDYDLGTTDTSSFPLLAIIPSNPNLPRTVNGFSMFSMDFELKLLDLADGSDKIHVYSDAVEVLKDIKLDENFYEKGSFLERKAQVILNANKSKLFDFHRQNNYDNYVTGGNSKMKLDSLLEQLELEYIYDEREVDCHFV